MKKLLITAYVHAYVPYHNGGAETTLHDLMRSLVEAGHRALVILKESPFAVQRQYEVEGVEVIQAKDKKTIVHYLPQSDLILTHLECSVRATLLAKQFKVPVAQIIHNNLDLTRNYIGHGPDFLIYNTEWIKTDFSDDFAHVPSLVVHPPIFADRYKTEHGKKVTLVNLFEPKGQDIFYQLVERLPEIEFLAVRGGYGEQIVKEYPNLEHVDNDFEIKNIFAMTKVVLMPSKYESYGRVACEALASGIPSIVSPTPGLMEALGDAGIYIPREDVDGWEVALKALLKPRRYGTMSKLALARSEALDVKAKAELETFTLFVEQFVTEYKRRN